MSDIGMTPSGLKGINEWQQGEWLHFARKAHRQFVQESGMDMTFAEYVKRQEATSMHDLIIQAGGVQAILYGDFEMDPAVPDHVKAAVNEHRGEIVRFVKRIQGDIGSDGTIEMDNRIRSERDQLMGKTAAPPEAQPPGGSDKAPASPAGGPA